MSRFDSTALCLSRVQVADRGGLPAVAAAAAAGAAGPAVSPQDPGYTSSMEDLGEFWCRTGEGSMFVRGAIAWVHERLVYERLSFHVDTSPDHILLSVYKLKQRMISCQMASYAGTSPYSKSGHSSIS